MTNNASDLCMKSGYTAVRNPLIKRLAASFGDIKEGHLTLVLPDGDAVGLGQENSAGPQACIRLNSYKPLSELFAKGDLAFAESYMQREWESPDLTALFDFGLAIEDKFEIDSSNNMVLKVFNRLRHILNRNSRRGSRRNIAYHYDLGNDFY